MGGVASVVDFEAVADAEVDVVVECDEPGVAAMVWALGPAITLATASAVANRVRGSVRKTGARILGFPAYSSSRGAGMGVRLQWGNVYVHKIHMTPHIV
jgi:hypothetical protein